MLLSSSLALARSQQGTIFSPLAFAFFTFGGPVIISIRGEVLIGSEDFVIVFERFTSKVAVKSEKLDEVICQKLRLLTGWRLGLGTRGTIVWTSSALFRSRRAGGSANVIPAQATWHLDIGQFRIVFLRTREIDTQTTLQTARLTCLTFLLLALALFRVTVDVSCHVSTLQLQTGEMFFIDSRAVLNNTSRIYYRGRALI